MDFEGSSPQADTDWHMNSVKLTDARLDRGGRVAYNLMQRKQALYFFDGSMAKQGSNL